MLRARKLSLAGIAVGALALTVSTTVPLAYGHGYTTTPISRAKLCANGTVQNCGAIQWEPQRPAGERRQPPRHSADQVRAAHDSCGLDHQRHGERLLPVFGR